MGLNHGKCYQFSSNQKTHCKIVEILEYGEFARLWKAQIKLILQTP